MSGNTEPAFDTKLGLLLLGRYRIVRKLGEGGMGAVYEGTHELIGKRLAIKCLHTQYTSNKEVVERFHREAHAATAVGNEHIIEVSDVGAFDDGSPFIVMEFLEGIELGKLIETEGSLPIARLIKIATQLCSALSAAHARGIVHRDMKPENIYLIKRDGNPDFVKVLDFGISKMREQNEALGGGLTKTGMALGTPYYMPPEQAQGVKDLDHRADIYAVGVILYQGLTGRLPFDAESYPALMVKILTEQPAPPGLFRRDIPQELEQVVMTAMAKDRARRFQTMDELAAALTPFAGITGEPVMIDGVRPSAAAETTPFAWTQKADTLAAGAAISGDTTQVPRKRSTGIVIGGAVAGAMIAAGAFFALRQPPAATPVVASPEPAPTPTPAPAAAAQPAAPVMQPALVAPKPTEVQVKITAQPKNAQIFIGGTEFPNPLDAWRPRSLDPIRIRVQLPGYRAVEQLAIFDQDRVIAFELERGQGVKQLATLGAPQEAAAVKPSAPPPVVIKPAAPAAPAEAPKPKPSDEVYQGPSGNIRDDF
jgi:eukaryotic-like serine/threonine-protein kinase